MAAGFKSGGRKAGTPNRATPGEAPETVAKALAADVSPLAVMLARMTGERIRGKPVSDEQFAAAIALAPYVHPRLQATTLKGDKDNPLLVHQKLDEARPVILDLLREYRATRSIEAVRLDLPAAEPASEPRPAEPVPEPEDTTDRLAAFRGRLAYGD